MSFKNRWTISSSYDFQAHLQHSQRRCCYSQTALLWFKVLPDLSPALSGLSPTRPGLSLVLPGAPRLVVGALSYSEGRQECPPRVWYSPEIDASEFTLHILSDTPGAFKWLKYILLMHLHPKASKPLNLWSTTRHVIWVINDIGRLCYSAFGQQLTACRFIY
jgi:hypothetical protein